MLAAAMVAFVGCFLVLMGFALVVTPRRWAGTIEHSDRATLQAYGGMVRVLFGLVLLYGAEASVYPEGVFAFGAVMIGVGVMVLCVKEARFSGWIDHWLRGGLVWRLRLGGCLALLAGALLCASVMPQ
ncbi:MAG: hypothetical protein E4H00_04820 [Myxococcales bacterium]|nr:MAG: hypothetical protein E4H00_04820 [Myxococcales bacterium]